MSLLSLPSVKNHASQLWRFIVCGGFGSILDLGSLTLFVQYAGIDQRIAVIFSSIVGASFVFVANKFFTFNNCERKTGSQALKFILVYGVSFIANILISNLLIAVGLHFLIAKVGAIGFGAFWNYALSHGFIFKKKEDIDVVIV